MLSNGDETGTAAGGAAGAEEVVGAETGSGAGADAAGVGSEAGCADPA